ncbi:MAG: hypothetical protein K6G44_02710, partial [Lentisphaeria bacterium]|nr:hypothetical protein [Lentisphaeria bacterium]
LDQQDFKILWYRHYFFYLVIHTAQAGRRRHTLGAGGTQAPLPKAQAGRTAPPPTARRRRHIPPEKENSVKGLFILVPTLLLN